MIPHPATMIGRTTTRKPFHDEWCPLNGCRCGDCGPCAEMPDCPPIATRKPAPFRVFKRHGTWVLAKSNWGEGISGFDSAADAVDHAYRNWPVWP